MPIVMTEFQPTDGETGQKRHRDNPPALWLTSLPSMGNTRLRPANSSVIERISLIPFLASKIRQMIPNVLRTHTVDRGAQPPSVNHAEGNTAPADDG